jgi:copper transport protein
MVRKCEVVAAIVIALFAGTPLRAAAHAELLSSKPPAQARLGLTPSTVVLDFSEPLSPAFSQATVIDPSGRPLTAHPASAFEIRVSLLTNLPGVYQVTWHAVSATDGHSTQGAFTFTVETAVSPTTGTPSRGPGLLDVLIAGGRWIEDGALLLASGLLFIVLLARRRDPIAWVRPRLLPPLLVALVAGLVVITGEAITAGVTVGSIPAYVMALPSGLARLGRVLLEAVACIAVVARVRSLLLVALPLALLALSASGHAAGAQPAWLGVALDTGHLLAASVWVGGILALATLRPPDGWRASGREVLSRFTPFALVGFAASAGLGVVQAITDVGDASALVTTAYGRVLIAKASAVAAIIPLSYLAWRHRRAHMRVEAAIGLVIVGAAALLASFPIPARTTAGREVPITATGLPSRGDVTLGAQAGQTLVGLTVDPAVPGMNTLTLYVSSVDGPAGAGMPGVTALVDGRNVPLRTCGHTCRSGRVGLIGRQSISVRVAGSQGGTAAFQLPSLPARDGSALLTAARAHMGGLHSVTLHETLTGGTGTTIMTDYREVAPDALAWTQPDGSTTIVVGAIRYARSQPGGPWTVETGNPTVSEPAFSWGLFAPDMGAYVLGSSPVGAVQTTVISFFAGSSATPVWFRFYVDAHDLVQRADMSAPGHFMTQTFANFDAPLRITKPVP